MSGLDQPPPSSPVEEHAAVRRLADLDGGVDVADSQGLPAGQVPDALTVLAAVSAPGGSGQEGLQGGRMVKEPDVMGNLWLLKM